MSKPLDPLQLKNHFSSFSDADLMTYVNSGVNNPDIYKVAMQVLHERQQARENLLHAELLTEMRKPHWSITPSFLVGVIAMIAACIAAYPVLFH